jgi:hypothetical protein
LSWSAKQQRPLDARHVAAQKLRHALELARDIARFVDELDQVAGDQAVGGLVDFDGKLRQEMVAQGGGTDERLVEAGEVVARGGGRRAAPGLGIAGKVEPALALAARRLMPALAVLGAGLRRLGLGRRLGGRAVVALEQRILLQLALDIGRELQIRQLQQLDSLLQLRRHHERLGLAEIESLGQRHGATLVRGNRSMQTSYQLFLKGG